MDFPRLSGDQRAQLEKATAKYEASMTSEALGYLAARGFNEEVVREWRLGYVQEPEHGHELAAGRISIPFCTPGGVVALRFRAIGESETKYIQPAGSSTHLFGMHNMHKSSDVMVITEGEFDCISMSMCGVPAIGLTGVSAWKKFYRRLFMDFEKVFIVMDPDKAGRQAAEKLRSELNNGVIIDLEVGDVNEAFLQKGPEFVRERLGLND